MTRPAPPAMAAAVERRIAELDAEIATHDESLAAIEAQVEATAARRSLVEALRNSAVRERGEFIKVRDAAPVEAPTEQPRPRQKPAAAILALLSNRMGRQAEGIVRELPGEDPSSVRRALKAHVDAGRLTLDAHGFYALPEPVPAAPANAAE